MAQYRLLILLGILTGFSLSACSSEQSTNANAVGDSVESCKAGPDFCKDTPEYYDALKKKKDYLLGQKYPSTLVDLLDEIGRCVAAIERAPDAFRLLSVDTDGTTYETDWDKSNEEAIRRGIKEGRYTAYYKYNANLAFKCHGDKDHDQRPDWDPDLNLNTDLVIKCAESAGSILCE